MPVDQYQSSSRPLDKISVQCLTLKVPSSVHIKFNFFFLAKIKLGILCELSADNSH